MKILLITNKIESTIKGICQLIQKSLNNSSLIDSKIKTLDFNEDDNIRIIGTAEKYRNFKFNSFIPEIIFIVPELMWQEDGVNEGYHIAYDLILQRYPRVFFQVVFLSVLRRDQILKIVEKRNEEIVKAFFHHDLLDKSEFLSYISYSKIHFECIKSLVVSDYGRLGKILHDFTAVKGDLYARESADYLPYKKYLRSQLEELSLFQTDLIQKDIDALNFSLLKADTLKNIMELLPAFDDLIQKIDSHYFNNSQEKSDKSNFRVLIIEDDHAYKHILASVFNELFSDVTIFNENDSSQKIIKAYEFVKENINEFDVFILDLLLKDNQHNWLGFNGLDLYEFIKKNNPFTAIRIVTNLPRDVISKIVLSTMNETIPLGHLFTKSKGTRVLENSIRDRSDEIVLECIENERRRNMWRPFPKNGLFGWPTIPGVLFHLYYDLPALYHQIVETSYSFYDHFKKIGTLKDEPNWSGELFSPKMKEKITQDSFLQRLPVILTYRLLVLDFTDMHNNCIVVETDKWKDILNSVSDIENFTINDFNTKLGFARTNSKRKILSNCFDLEITDLFPHERIIVSNLKEKYVSDRYLPENLNDLFISILVLESTWDVWMLLNLGFDPYDNEKIQDEEPIAENIIITQFSWSQLREFFESLMKYYNNAPKQINNIIHQIENLSELVDSSQFHERFDDFIEELSVLRLK